MIWFMACLLVLQRTAAHFTHQWALHISGGPSIADQVALDHGFVNLGEIFEDYYHFAHPRVQKRSLREHTGLRTRLTTDDRVRWSKQQRAKSRKKRDLTYLKSAYTDPRWPNMWYLNRGGGLDMNVLPAWQEGFIGKGAVVTILDDGLEKDHPDLLQNYDPEASYDVNNHDSDPSPRYDMIDSNRHGTRCAGEVAATSNNSICALGVAHGAQIGGVRMLDGDVTDAVEARSLSLNPHHIDIYSASWGPDDDGRTVDGPGELAMRAFIEGVTKGRRGKGSIFIWASGNGGRDHDNCNCDGYTNSIYSLSISSATESGHVPWYSEACSSTLATTYSSGAAHEKQIVTTDLHHSCTISHTGTSASAPLAAGICALALQANPKLTWRDMQHIVVRTARPENLIANDWQVNGVGRNVSHSFGYGLMDAYAMVKLASKWKTVPEQRKCEIPAPHFDKLIPAQSVVVVKLHVTECPGVEVLEHVQAKLSIATQRRGDLQIHLQTPMGTKVTLLAHRIHDNSKNGFYQWPFMSVHSWGESPIGVWQLEIHNDGRMLAQLKSWKLSLYGTKKMPVEQQQIFKTTQPTHATSTTSEPESKKGYDLKYDLDVVTKKTQALSTNTTALFGNKVLYPDGNRPFLEDEPNHLELDYGEEQSAVAFSGCSKSRADLCLECGNSTIFYNGSCVKKCPERYYTGTLERLDVNLKQSIETENNVTHGLVCLECHYSCLRCRGGLDYECTECFEDAKLYMESPNEAYCYPQYTLHLIRDTALYYELCLLMVLILASSLVIIVAVFILNRISCASRDTRGHNNANLRQRDNNLRVNIYSDSE